MRLVNTDRYEIKNPISLIKSAQRGRDGVSRTGIEMHTPGDKI